jgi:hypothetical protein
MATEEILSRNARRIGFTGSRDLDIGEEVAIERILWSLSPDRVVTGACVGIDQFVAEFYACNVPDVFQTVYVPGDRSRVNMSFIDFMLKLRQVNVIFMPRQSSYLDRNMKIVESSDELVGFPRFHESHQKSRRSGTWQTIRRARSANKKVTLHVLSELITNPHAS